MKKLLGVQPGKGAFICSRREIRDTPQNRMTHVSCEDLHHHIRLDTHMYAYKHQSEESHGTERRLRSGHTEGRATLVPSNTMEAVL